MGVRIRYRWKLVRTVVESSLWDNFWLNFMVSRSHFEIHSSTSLMMGSVQSQVSFKFRVRCTNHNIEEYRRRTCDHTSWKVHFEKTVYSTPQSLHHALWFFLPRHWGCGSTSVWCSLKIERVCLVRWGLRVKTIIHSLHSLPRVTTLVRWTRVTRHKYGIVRLWPGCCQWWCRRLLQCWCRFWCQLWCRSVLVLTLLSALMSVLVSFLVSFWGLHFRLCHFRKCRHDRDVPTHPWLVPLYSTLTWPNFFDIDFHNSTWLSNVCKGGMWLKVGA